MPSYLLDTNILSDLIRNPQGKVYERLRTLELEQTVTNVIVAGELRFGAAKKGSAQLTQRVESILSHMKVLILNENVGRDYARIRADLESKGTPIGGNDLWIAAHVKALSYESDWVLVTANQREFERVEGLKVESWL